MTECQKIEYNTNIKQKGEMCYEQQAPPTIKRVNSKNGSDEQDYFDMMPENLQGSMNGMNSEEAIDKMDDAIACVEEAIEAIEEII